MPFPNLKLNNQNQGAIVFNNPPKMETQAQQGRRPVQNQRIPERKRPASEKYKEEIEKTKKVTTEKKVTEEVTRKLINSDIEFEK